MKTREIEDGVIQIRGCLVSSYLLTDGREAALVDSGFIGGVRQIEEALERVGLGWKDLRAVLLTHGHLDHTLNLSAIVERSGAKLYLHPNDRLHLAGQYPYRGLVRICGGLEWLGRRVLGYRPAGPFEALSDGQRLDLLGGIRALLTPGHTAGHCAFLWEPKRLLFAGDLFACWWARTTLPWPWLNSCPERFPASMDTIRAAPANGLLANHCDSAGSAVQLNRFRAWHRRCGTPFDTTGCVI